MLFHIDLLRDAVQGTEVHTPKKEDKQRTKHKSTICKHLQIIFAILAEGDEAECEEQGRGHHPLAMLDYMGRGATQEDPSELLVEIMDCLDLFPNIGNVCSWTKVNSIECACGWRSEKRADMLVLDLVLESAKSISLANAVKSYFSEEKIKGGSKDYMDCGGDPAQSRVLANLGCGLKKQPGTRACEIHEMSPVLIVSFDRFSLRGGRKTNASVTFAGKLDIEQTEYRLVAVISHIGQTKNSGHYVAEAIDAKEDKWYHFDDGKVTRASPPFEREGVRPKNREPFKEALSLPTCAWRSTEGHEMQSACSHPSTL